MMLPIVTGTRLEARKWPQVTFERSGVFWEATKADNPHIKYHSNRRGYIACTATPDAMRTRPMTTVPSHIAIPHATALPNEPSPSSRTPATPSPRHAHGASTGRSGRQRT